jgi:hypothetical protein
MEESMNPNFKFGRLNRRTLLSVSRAIGPVEIGIEALDDFVVKQIESQIRCFPRLHRVGFCVGLVFIELGGWIGGWGIVPFSWLKRDRATRRLYRLLHSRFTPVRLLANGLRVLVCLSAYGHSEVEQWYGFERRAWRDQRLKTRDALLASQHLDVDSDWHALTLLGDVPPTPNPLYGLENESQHPLLSWESHQLEGATTTSPFILEDYLDEDEVSTTPDPLNEVSHEDQERVLKT